MKLLRQLRALFRKETLDREMSEEMRAHLELQTERNIRAGMDPDAARYKAQRQFGHAEGIKEVARAQWGIPWLEEIAADVRYGARQLRRAPGFATVAILTLAIGIGATTAIFSIVNSVVLRSLPYPAAGQLAVVFETQPPKSARLGVSPKSYGEWRKQATSLQGCAIFQNMPFVMTGVGEAIRRFGFVVTTDYFNVFGVQPILGRTFVPEDGVDGRNNVTVLNHKLWVSQFNSDPGVIGRKVILDNTSYTIIGVMPASFLPEQMTDPWLFVPMVISPKMAENFQARFFKSIARVKPGTTLEQATTELNVIAARLAANYPDTNKGFGVALEPMLDNQIGSVRPLLLTLLGAVGFLLLIACVNVANLLLARASSRHKEIAVRAALGASRGRIIRQLLSESLSLSILGSALGIVLAYASKNLLLGFAPLGLPRLSGVGIDGTALLFTCLLSAITGVGFGLAPALQATRINLPEAMKDGGRGASEGGTRLRLRSALVVLEVSLALVLLLNAGLLIRSFNRLHQVDMGYELGVGVTQSNSFILTSQNYSTPEKVAAFSDRLIARISAVPDVESAALATAHPMFFRRRRIVIPEGQTNVLPTDLEPASYYSVTPAYFGIFRIKLRYGRLFDERDRPGGAPVAIVSESFVHKYFPTGNPLGRRVQMSGNPTWKEIVGVVNDVREDGPAGPVSLQVYEPFAQQPSQFVNLIFRLERPIAGIRKTLRAALDSVDPNLPLNDMKDGMDLFWLSAIGNQRFALFIFSIFSGVALLLSAIGIYGVVAYSVSQRTQEIGIRMALGAQARDIMGLILGQTGRLVVLGLVIGIASAIASTRLLTSLLFEVGAQDPVTFVIVPLLLAAIAFLACWLPARRATKVDPLVALRHE